MKQKRSTTPTNDQNSDLVGSIMTSMNSPGSDSGYSSGEQVVRTKRTRCEERRLQQLKRQRMIDDANAEVESNHAYYSYLKACELFHLEVPEEFKINGRLTSGMKAFTIETKK